MSLDARLQRLWYGSAWRTLPLWPLAALFGAAAGLRRLAYGGRARHAGVPVIVVGNLTVGGTGKTPVAAWLSGRLGARGLRVGVVLRGYGGRVAGARVVGSSDDPAEVGDEALLHARRGVQVVVTGRDRVAAARLAVAEGAEVLVCDDGLQHYQLARDYEIAVVDGERGFGNGRLLPAGPLREPVARLDRVDAVVVTWRTTDVHTTTHAAVPRGPAPPRRLDVRLVPGAAVPVLDGERRPLEHFAGRDDLHGVAAIGHPEAFFAALRARGLRFTAHALPDHAVLDRAALPFPRDATVLMTEKDAVKCRSFGQPGWWWVDLSVEVDADAAEGLLASILDRTGLARAGATLG